jgi:Flp pilus assembly protein TadD
MPFRLLAVTALVLVTAFASPMAADRRADAKDQVDFGMSLAKSGLWKVAVHHWEKAVELDETYAAAWNNLAIGYEQMGRFAEARKAYERAMQLDPPNNYIRHNYEQFREIYDRQNRRRMGG